MHYQNSGIFPTQKDKAFQDKPIQQHKFITTAGIWFNRFTRRLSIHQKIACGYVLSISIAVLGTGAGLIVGEHYDDKATTQFGIAQKRYEQLDHLEKSVWEVKFHQQQLLLVSGNKALEEKEINQLQASITEANQRLDELQVNLKNYSDVPQDYATQLKGFLQICDQEVDAFALLLQSLSKEINSLTPTPGNLQRQEQIFQEIIKGKQATKFEQLSETLDHLVQSTVEQEKQAAVTFRQAKVLRLIIIIVSMVLSIIIAVALAFYTSRAIARPIKAVTKVAKQATQESNFELQAPVTSHDEIGILATSLNQLIQQVAAQIRELKQAQAQLIQGEKMSSLGQMVAGIAHEINNPANFIYANIDYVNRYTEDLLELVYLYQQNYPQPSPEIKNKIEESELDFINEDLPKIMASMHTGTERIRQIILSLRTFCHLDEAEMKKVDIHEGIDNTLLILNHRINRGIEVIKQYEKLPLLECYPAQLNQVFWHILSNAIDELLMHKHLCRPQIFIQTQRVNSNEVEVRIRDNGMGVDPEIRDKIFDPFFTTKPVGEGTGMGLAICYQIVEKHQGKLQLISEVGQGAEFIITLPR